MIITENKLNNGKRIKSMIHELTVVYISYSKHINDKTFLQLKKRGHRSIQLH